MKRAKRTIVILSLALASCGGPVMSPAATPQVINLRLMATAATSPLLSTLVNAYSQVPATSLTHTLLAVDLTSAGWPAVQARLLAGDIQFATTTTLTVSPDLWAAPIALDGIAIIVNPISPIKSLTTADLRAIFQGRTTTWTAFSEADWPIIPVSYEAGDDLRLSFEALALDGHSITQGARLVLTPVHMIDVVLREPGAIGYISLTALAQYPHTASVVAIDPGTGIPVRPMPQTLYGTDPAIPRYPLMLPVLVVGREPPAPDSPAYALFAWMQGEEGQSITHKRIEVWYNRYP